MTSAQSRDRFDTVVLDIDGTLVDSVYAHVWSWHQAFRLVGIDVATWRIHRAVGMGGDKLVPAVTNDTVEERMGDEVRSRQAAFYDELSAQLSPTPGASELLRALHARGLAVVLASSGSREVTDRAVELLEARGLIDATVSGDDADDTKPDVEPLQRAVDAVHGQHAVAVGDAVWDMQAAVRAGCTPVGLLTGGISVAELREGGAVAVYDDPATLTDVLGQSDRTPFDVVLRQARL